ncbi:MAG: hypothetical protein GXY98_03810 [Erysipelothrix sp.]|nr:hypothetical protein [Erysipelothrix sp.]
MAKYERRINRSLQEVVSICHDTIIKGSMSASFEDGSSFIYDGVHCEVRVYERYSYLGQNRVSLNLTVVGDNNSCQVSCITSGGSQAMLFKINTFGESSFLNTLISRLETL